MSRFISAGAIDAATGHAVAADPPAEGDAVSPPAAGASSSSNRQGEWEAVSRELEEQRRQREAEARRLAEGGEKSLFAILQENKAAKQAAFEEANRIKNQFRALDDDEVEFLEEVQASTRREEDRTRREVQEGLDRFREAQRKGGGGSGGVAAPEGEDASGTAADTEEDWAAGRKRRRKDDGGRAGMLKGVVRRKTSGAKPAADQKTAAAQDGTGPGSPSAGVDGSAKVPPTPPAKPDAPPSAAAPSAKPGGLGLVAYGSDDDSD